MDGCRALPRLSRAALSGWVLLLASAAPLPAQGGWLDRAREAAEKTGVGMGLTRATAVAQLLSAPRIALDESGLGTLAVGPLTLGVSAVDVRNGVAVRVHGYLLNPSGQPVTIPAPAAELFVLVDAQGRRLERLDGPDVEGVAAGAGEITVPALERVPFTLLYGGLAAGAQRGNLKVGELGVISAIPLNTSAAPGGARRPAGEQNVWAPPTGPAAPAPAAGSAPTPPQPPQ